MVANNGPVHAAAERVSARNSDSNGEGLMRSGCVKGRRALPPPDGTNLPTFPAFRALPAFPRVSRRELPKSSIGNRGYY